MAAATRTRTPAATPSGVAVPRQPDWFAWISADNVKRGGMNLGGLFITILDTAIDQDVVTVEDVRVPVEKLIGHQVKRMGAVYRGEDLGGQDVLTVVVRDALGYLVFRGFLFNDGDGRYRYNTALPMGRLLEITPSWVTGGITREPLSFIPRPAAERAHLQELEGERESVTHAAFRLLPTGPGLRPVHPKRVQEIKDSIEEYGLRDDAFPILLDKQGRILGGRHRMVVERDLGLTWRRVTLDIDTDADALAVAWLDNQDNRWSPSDLHKLEKMGVKPGHFSLKARKAQVELELRHDAARSNTEIGRAAGVDHKTVEPIRQRLEETGEIPRFLPQLGGRGKTTREEVEPGFEPAATSAPEPATVTEPAPSTLTPEPAPEAAPTEVEGYTRTDANGKVVVVRPYKGKRGKLASPPQSTDTVTAEVRDRFLRLVFELETPWSVARKEVGLGVTIARRLYDQERGRLDALAAVPPPAPPAISQADATSLLAGIDAGHYDQALDEIEAHIAQRRLVLHQS